MEGEKKKNNNKKKRILDHKKNQPPIRCLESQINISIIPLWSYCRVGEMARVIFDFSISIIVPRIGSVCELLSTTRSSPISSSRTLARLVTILRLCYHLVSRLHFSIDDEVVDVVVLRSAPGAALPQNGLVRLFISGNESFAWEWL